MTDTVSSTVSPNKRKFLRFNASLDGFLRLEGATPPVPVPIQDVSKEGLRLSTKRNLTRGIPVQLEIILPGELVPLFTEGQVAWCRPAHDIWKKENDLGIKITRIDPFDLSRLLDFAYESWLHIQRR